MYENTISSRSRTIDPQCSKEKFSCTLPTSPPLRYLCRWQTVHIIMLILSTAKLILDVPDFFKYKKFDGGL